jgi:hypothetical protein
MNPDSKSKIAIPFFIFINALILFIVWEYPAISTIRSNANIYRAAITDDMPNVRFDESGIEFIGHKPYEKTLVNGIKFRIDSQMDSALFDTFPQKSIWITDDNFYYRNKNGSIDIPLNNIKSDKIENFNGAEIKLRLDKSFNNIFTIATLVILGVTLIVMLLLALLGAGFGSIVDAFAEGPFGYRHMLNIASIFQFGWIVVTTGIFYVGVTDLKIFFVMLLFYLLSIMGFVYYMIRREGSRP